jgi:hypothetical protein
MEKVLAIYYRITPPNPPQGGNKKPPSAFSETGRGGIIPFAFGETGPPSLKLRRDRQEKIIIRKNSS